MFDRFATTLLPATGALGVVLPHLPVRKKFVRFYLVWRAET